MAVSLLLNSVDKSFVDTLKNEVLAEAKLRIQSHDELNEQEKNGIFSDFDKHLENQLDKDRHRLFSFYGTIEAKNDAKAAIRTKAQSLLDTIDNMCREYIRIKNERFVAEEEKRLFDEIYAEGPPDKNSAEYKERKAIIEQRFKNIENAVKELTQKKSSAETKREELEREFEKKRKDDPYFMPSDEEIKKAKDLITVNPEYANPQENLAHLKERERLDMYLTKYKKEQKEYQEKHPKHFWTSLMELFSWGDEKTFGGADSAAYFSSSISISISFWIILTAIISLLIVLYCIKYDMFQSVTVYQS